jgi:hypothetical protein
MCAHLPLHTAGFSSQAFAYEPVWSASYGLPTVTKRDKSLVRRNAEYEGVSAAKGVGLAIGPGGWGPSGFGRWRARW